MIALMRTSSMGLVCSGARCGAVRVNGLAVLFAIVVIGLATGAGFYRFKRQEMDQRLAVEMAAVPEGPEERLDLWLRYVGPQIHHRLAEVGRFTAEMPWLVTHARPEPDGGAPELWGIVCAALPRDLARREGMRIVVELPPPHALGRAPLGGERKERVPVHADLSEAEADARLTEVAVFLLEGIPKALERDIPGASLEVRVVR